VVEGVGGQRIRPGIARHRLQAVTVRHDREDAARVGGIAFEMHVEHEIDRSPPMPGIDLASHSIERAGEPVVGAAVIVLEAGRVVSGGVQGGRDRVGDGGRPRRLAGIATAGVAMALDDQDAKRVWSYRSDRSMLAHRRITLSLIDALCH
jgi:hypothetical protein